MAVTYEEIISDLKKRIFKPVYFLAGEEPYYIDLITNYIEDKILPEAEKAFNQIIVYGDDTNISAIIDTARQVSYDGQPPGGYHKRSTIIKKA